MRIRPLATVISAVASLTVSSSAQIVYNSTATGIWEDIVNWIDPVSQLQGIPQTGTVDSANILAGHTITYQGGAGGVGLNGSGDFGISGDQVVNINGGVLTQTPPNFWIRIGHETKGTLNINDGRFHFTDSTNEASPNLQIGIRGGAGVVKVGDGIGAAGSAVLNLRDVSSGTANGNFLRVNMNLGSSSETSGYPETAVGSIVIESDGRLEGDVRASESNDAVIRVGQGRSDLESSIIVKAGGKFNVHGRLEVAAEGGSKGLIRIDGQDARLDMDDGEFTIGWNGAGSLILDNGGVYSKTNSPIARGDILIGREAAAVGTVIVQNGAQLLRGPGGLVGDLRIGYNGTGSMTIASGGLVLNEAGNWDWIGENNGSNGTLTINAGGTFRTTAGSNFNIGVNTGATGLVVLNGGELDLQSTSAAQMRIGQNGNGTFRQISGTTNVQGVFMAETNGTATFDLQGGTFNSRGSFFMGGTGAGSQGTGTATATQSGGTLTVAGALVVGLAGGHTATYTQTGGTIEHTGSDISVGESGIGTMTIGAGGTLNDVSGGQFFVGRNNGSQGTLLVNGTLSRTVSSFPIRVGNGNTNGTDNTDAPGVLGGTGTIDASAGGVWVGSKGTITGGSLSTVGALNLLGTLNFSEDGVLFANFDGANGADRLNLQGFADITNAVLDGDWLNGGATGINSRYWLLVNDDVDPITGTFKNVSLTSSYASLFPDADAWALIDGQEFAVFYDADFATNAFTGGNDLLLAAVPEPSTALMLPAMLALGMLRRRRK